MYPQHGLISLLSIGKRKVSEFLTSEFHCFKFRLSHPLGTNEWGLISPYGIGDTYIICALAEAILRIHGGEKVTVFVKPQHSTIPDLFPSVNKCIVEDLSSQRLSLHLFQKGRPYCVDTEYDIRALFLGYKGINLVDLIRVILHLPMTARLSIPKAVSNEERQNASLLFQNYGLPIGRTVILCPDANSIPLIPNDFWEKLALRLNNRGWVSVTNSGPRSQIIPGTIRGEFSLAQIRAIAETAGWVISLRSGLCDLLSSCTTSLSVLYPRIAYYQDSLIASTSLRSMQLSDRVMEYEMNTDYENLISKILNEKLNCDQNEKWNGDMGCSSVSHSDRSLR